MSKHVASLLSEVSIKHTACLLLALLSLMASAQDRGFAIRRLQKMTRGLFLCCCMIVCNVSLHAQISSEGKDFYLGFLSPSYNTVVHSTSAGFFRVYAYVSSYKNNVVTVSYFNKTTGKEEVSGHYNIQAGRAVQIQLDYHHMQMLDPGDIAGEF